MICTATQAVEHIHSLSKFGKKAGLSNITLMMERLGNPHKKMRYIHVAGTNGKGSVSNMIKNILINHGYKVGYYTSPYIEFFSERICIGDQMISDSDLVYYTNRVKEVCYDINPIEFEFITAMAFLYFAEQKCDITVLEVGLGGRLDSTNIIDTPLLNVITPIGYDHTAILGESLADIAFEKAGTIKVGATVVVSPDMVKESLDVIRERCRVTFSKLIVPEGRAENISYDLPYTSFEYMGERYSLSLAGTYQVGNAITAIEAAKALADVLDITRQDIAEGIKNSFWKCRFEICASEPKIVLDGAHNSHGIRALMDSIEAYFPSSKRVFLFSMLGEKDWRESVDIIAKHTDSVVVTTVPSLRPTPADDILSSFKSEGMSAIYIENYCDALEYAENLAYEDGVVFVFGSLYLAGAIRTYINERGGK